MNRAVAYFFLLVFLASSVLCMAQVLTVEEWDKRATRVFQDNENRQTIESQLCELLQSQSLAFLVDVLNQPRFPALRIGAFHAIKTARPDLELTSLFSLLANSHDALFLYEPEFELLKNRLGKKDADASSDIASFMSRNFEGEKLATIVLVLRLIPVEQLWLLLDNREEKPVIPASNLAAIIERLCGVFPNWIDLDRKSQLLTAMEDIKNSSGYAQAVILEHYPFQSDSDAIDHVRFVFEDASLSDTAVILSAKRHRKLIMSSQSELVTGKNSELVRRRLEEFKRRFPSD